MNFKDAKIFLFLLLLCFLQIGIPLIWFNPADISQDTFYYVTIANYYLFSPLAHIRDAFTVGPVIPALIAAIKFTTLKLVHWTPDVDIAILKVMAFFCYVVMTMLAYMIMIKDVSKRMAIVVLFISLGLLGSAQDTMSLNGELVVITLLSTLMVVLQKQERSAMRYAVVAILSAITIYTKLQSIPLLLLLLASESKSKKELSVIFLYVFSALAVSELLLYFHGVGLVKNLTNMYVYVSKGAASGTPLIGTIESISYLDVLILLAILTKSDFSFVYIILVLLVIGKPGPSKNIFSDWKTWLAVTVFTIAAPGRPFEHYLLFFLPFIFRFAGPAVASARFAAIKPEKWRYFQIGMATFLLIELYHSALTLNPHQWPWETAFPRFSARQNLNDVRTIINRNPGTVFVNGWDYQVYSYLNAYGPREELPLVIAGAIDEREYVNNLANNRFDYLIDTIDYSGLLRDRRYALSAQGMAGTVVAKYYDLVYDKDKLRLYKLKATPQPAYVPLGAPQHIALSSLGSPAAGGSGAPASTSTDFSVSYAPQGSISRVKYTIYSFNHVPQGMSIDIYNECNDGRRIRRSIDMDHAKFNAENEAYFDNSPCSSRWIELHFRNEGADPGQWLNLVGVDGY